jgi:hypothetical protein
MVSHPFHKEREMDGARIIFTLTVKMFWEMDRRGRGRLHYSRPGGLRCTLL